MTLKTVRPSLDELDATLAAFYAEGEDGFVLGLEGIDDHPEVKNLKTAHERVKKDREKLRAELEMANGRLKELPEDFDPEAWADYREFRSRHPEQQVSEAEIARRVESRLDRRLKQASERHAGELAAVQKDRDRYHDALRQQLVLGGLTDALIAAKVRPELLDGARAKLGQQARMVEADDGFKVLLRDGAGDDIRRLHAVRRPQ